MHTNQKLCGHCRHFLGGGDFGLCCSKKYDLCYAETEWPACEFYEYDENQKWLVQCPDCGQWVVWYAPFQKKYLNTIYHEDLLLKRYWYCKDCDLTIMLEVEDRDGNNYFVGGDENDNTN